MTAVRGVVRGGVVLPLEPLDWPEGQAVLIVCADEALRSTPPAPLPLPLPPLPAPRALPSLLLEVPQQPFRRNGWRIPIRLAAALLFLFLVAAFCGGAPILFY